MTNFSDALLPAPRLIVVLSGAASMAGSSNTALEHAVMPNLRALSRSGRVGRLRLLAPHVEAHRANALAALAGLVVGTSIDQAAVAARAGGVELGRGSRCWIVRVCDAERRPAPALEVHRVAQALRGQLPDHRVVGQRRAHELLLAGIAAPLLPRLDGVLLELLAGGEHPAPVLGERTVVVGRTRGTLVGVGGLLGARTIAIDHQPHPRGDLERSLRRAATEALFSGAETVVVDVPTALTARRRAPHGRSRELVVGDALSFVDRAVLGPLWTAAGWLGATLVVTADLPVGEGDAPLRGDVPIVTSAPRSVVLPEPAPALTQAGTTAPPRYCERGLLGLPIVTSPLRLVPEPERAAPRRFTRDPVSGLTQVAERAIDQRVR